MSYFATSPLPICNKTSNAKLSDWLPFSVQEVLGYDICNHLVDMQHCLVMPAATLCEAASYIRAEGDHCYTLAPDTLLISDGGPTRLSSMPEGALRAASMKLHRPEAHQRYQHSMVVESDGVLHRFPLITTPDIQDVALERATSPTTALPPLPAIRLLCPEGFYPVLGKELILGTELLG